MILIATDFSAGSLHAAHVGLVLAMHTDSRAKLVHAYSTPSRSGMLMSMEDHIRQAAEQDMAEFLGRLPKELHAALDGTEVMHGFPEEVMQKLEARGDVGLVVIGTQGDNAMREIFMGHTGAALLKKVKCPVLAVPREASTEAPQGLVLAWDGGQNDRNDCDAILDLARRVGVPLQVVVVRNNPSQTPDAGMLAFFAERGVPVNEIAGEGDAKDELDAYLQRHPGSWMALINRENKGFFGRLFHDSLVKRELFTASCPILIR